MNNYYELNIFINPDMEELMTDFFFTNFDCEGILPIEETYKDLELTSTTKGCMKVFFKSYPNNLNKILDEEKRMLLERGLTENELGSWEYALEEKENQDWSRKWKEKWSVTHVGEKIAIVPSWIDYIPNKNEIIINLDPGSAFGTGTHQTTQLCMKSLEKYVRSNFEVADIGTGSGILAILAKKLGAINVYACDNDNSVIDICKENAKINGITDIIFEFNTADKISYTYDFVCANILHFVLADIMKDLKNILKPNGYLSLSGILEEKKDIVLDAIKRENLKIIETLYQDNWISYVVIKESECEH